MKEPRKIRWNVLAAIEYVCEQTKDKQLKYENTPRMQKCLEHLKSYFGGINEIQVIILCGLLDIDLSKIKDMTISKYLNISSLKYLQHNAEIEELAETIINTGHSYSFKEDVIKSILRNQEIIHKDIKYDAITFTEKIRNIIDSDWEDYDTKMREAYDFEQKHLDIPFVKEINDCIKSYKDRYCLYSPWHYYTHGWVASLQQLG